MPKITRRDASKLLGAGLAAAGLNGLGLPGMAGAAEAMGGSMDTSKWLKNHFHIDLSDVFEGEDYWLHANGQRYDLKKHTPATRKQARQEAAHLRDVPDAQMTHYVKGHVLLPHDQVIRVHIKHSLKTKQFDYMNDGQGPQGGTGAYHAYMVVPPVREEQREFRYLSTSNTTPPPAGGNPPKPHHHHVDWTGTAKALLFHHGDLVTHNPTIATTIFSHMDVASNPTLSAAIGTLAGMMKSAGAAKQGAVNAAPGNLTKTNWTMQKPIAGGGWADMVAVKPEQRVVNGKVMPPTGTTYYQQLPTDFMNAVAGFVMTQLMVSTKNDHKLQKRSWYQTVPGETVNSTTATAALNSGGAVAGGAMQTEELASVACTPGNDDWNATLTNTSTNHGLQVSLSTTDHVKKQISVTFDNSYIRYLGAYIAFYDSDANYNSNTAMSAPTWTPDGIGALTSTLSKAVETDEVRFLGMVSPINNAFAVPIGPDGNLKVSITFPAGAVRARVFGAGLGTGHLLYPVAPAPGGICTGVFNLAVPAFMLGFAVAAQTYYPLYKILQNRKVILGIIGVGVVAFAALFAKSAVADHKMNWSALTSLISIIFTKAATKALIWCEAEIAAGEIEDEIPFAGWLMIGINIATGVAQMAETITEVATSPWQIENGITTSINSTVTVHPDPGHQAWPQGQTCVTSYAMVKMIFKNSTRPTVSVKVPIPDSFSAATFNGVFDNNTLGGLVKFEVDYYLGNWIAARASTGYMENNEANSACVTLYLVQIPVPINKDTVFAHTKILQYNNNAFDWAVQAAPPTDTITSAYNAATGNGISQWMGLGLSQAKAVVGAAYKAAGTGLGNCVGGATNTQLWSTQNTSIPGKPMSDHNNMSCGFSDFTQVIYDVYPPKFKMKGGTPNNYQIPLVPDPSYTPLGDYYVDPRKANNLLTKDGGFHLRKSTITGTSANDPKTATLSYGRFPWSPDHAVIHPSGHVIGVNTPNGKVMILALEESGKADDQVPVARQYAGKALNNTRQGLLYAPLAVSCSYDGTIFILDQYKSSAEVQARIQAFDLTGNPAPVFKFSSGTSAILDLPPGTTSGSGVITYLDLVAVGNIQKTYIFVLYYTGQGSVAADYHVAIYEYAQDFTNSKPAKSVTSVTSIPAARINVDMWHTLYTLNYQMVQDSANTQAGPGGRTLPSISEWEPSVPGQKPCSKPKTVKGQAN